MVSGKQLMIVGGGLLVLFTGLAIWLNRMRIETRPTIDVCNEIGIQAQRAAGRFIAACGGEAVPDGGLSRFSPVEDSSRAFAISAFIESPECSSNSLKFQMRFVSPCDSMISIAPFRISLPPKDVSSVREDLRPGIVEACRMVLEANCDCRAELGIPAGPYAASCDGISRDRQGR